MPTDIMALSLHSISFHIIDFSSIHEYIYIDVFMSGNTL